MKPFVPLNSFAQHANPLNSLKTNHATRSKRHKSFNRASYLNPFSRSDPPLFVILRHVSVRNWVILGVSLVFVIILSAWAIFLNFSHSEILNHIEDPTFKGVITIDTLPKPLAGSPADPESNMPGAVAITFTSAQLRGFLDEMEATGASSAHVAFIQFSAANVFFRQTGIPLHSGDFVDIKITAPVASALLESIPSTASPDDSFYFFIPITKSPFGGLTLGVRSFLRNISWRTELDLEEISTISAGLAVTAFALFLLCCHYAYREAKYDTHGDIIMMADNSFPDDYDDFD